MNKLVIRHGLSEANNRANFGTPAFGSPSAPLMEEGLAQAVVMGLCLEVERGIDVPNTPVATSYMRRAHETAMAAGFRRINLYHSLSEVTANLSFDDINQIRQSRIIPAPILKEAEYVLNHPPSEEIWITHGLLIASMCQVLNIYQSPEHKFIPAFCEIREAPIGNPSP